MKEVWTKYLRGPLFLYFEIYTVATLINSITYLAQGVYEDPSGNWHEIDRAVLVLIVVVAYALIRYIKVNNLLLKTIMVYVPTLLLVYLYVFLRGLTAELAKTAYRDVFINYTIGFVFVSVVVCIVTLIGKKKHKPHIYTMIL